MHANSFRHSITFYAKALFLCLAFSATTLKAAENSAGTVTFMLGKAFINGDSPIQVGSKIKAGDVIETLGNGHVHIRFVDNGLVSVRPDSRLFIEQYQFNAEKPTDSVIKFVLEEGIMRSISGTGAKAARDKFRLNTPIAAIGVRGTDFVVKSSDNLLQAVVNEGAIAVAPYSEECQVSAIGPCKTNIVELSSEQQQLLEFNNLLKLPRLLPLSSAIDANFIEEQLQSSKEKKIKSSSQLKKSDDENSLTSTAFMNESSALSSLTTIQKSANSTTTVSSPSEVSVSKIAWGRFSDAQTAASLEGVLSFDEAKQDRLTGIYADSIYSGYLIAFRSASDNETINTSLGDVSFALSSADAYLKTANDVQNVAVKNGELNINFSSREFTTTLNLYNELTSNVQYTYGGSISRFGYFYSKSSDSAISLATSLEGDESSYYFMKKVDAGTIEGITYWNGVGN